MQYIGKDIVTRGSLLHLNRDIAWKELRSRAKQGIRKARKAGIRVEESRDLSQMEKLWYDPETLTKELSDQQTLYLAYLEDELVGGIIITPITPNTLFYHYGGTNEKGRLIEANAYLFWHVVEQFHDSSFEYLDVGVSYRSELQHFFQKYCSQPYPILFNPPPENVRPRIGLEPFSISDDNTLDEPVVAINTRLSEFFEADFTFMPSWPFALQSALRALELKPEQSVGVWASAGEESYLASLKQMFGSQFKFELRNPDADAYLIAHRWGLNCPEVEILALEDKPLIEDCRDALETGKQGIQAGSYGRFAVYDFARWFPMQFGAALVGKYFPDQEVWDHFHCLDVGKRNAVREALQLHWPNREAYARLRKENARRFTELFGLLGFRTVPALHAVDAPAFLLHGIDPYTVSAIQKRLASFDIQTEFDENDNLIALPCHCRLKHSFVEYIFGAVRGMINPCHTYVREDPTLKNNMAKHKYLVTGGAGFIGSNIVEALLKRGDQVVVLDNFSTGRRVNLAPFMSDIELHEADLRDPDAVKKSVQGCDFILHQGALPSVPRSVADPMTSNEVNVTGTLNILMAARDAGVKRVVAASSSSVYGNTPTLPKVETMPVLPMSPYAVSKLATEKYLAAFYHVYGLETVALRYFNIFGPRQDPSSQYSAVIPKFITSLMRREQPVVHGDGLQSRDFTYVENAVEANLLACHAEGAAGEFFNIACGERCSLLDILHGIADRMGSDIVPIHEPSRPGDVKHSLADISKAKQILGYKVVAPFQVGLVKTVDHFTKVSS